MSNVILNLYTIQFKPIFIKKNVVRQSMLNGRKSVFDMTRVGSRLRKLPILTTFANIFLNFLCKKRLKMGNKITTDLPNNALLLEQLFLEIMSQNLSVYYLTI